MRFIGLTGFARIGGAWCLCLGTIRRGFLRVITFRTVDQGKRSGDREVLPVLFPIARPAALKLTAFVAFPVRLPLGPERKRVIVPARTPVLFHAGVGARALQ